MAQMFLEIALSNALVALPLAALAFAVSRAAHRPALTHALWLLVLIKLITPPLFWVSVPLPEAEPPVVAQPQALTEAPPEFGQAVRMQVGQAVAPDRAAAERAFVELTGVPLEWVPLEVPPTLPVEPVVAAAPIDFVAWLGALWGFGALISMALALAQIRRFSRFARSATPAPAELVREVALLCRRLGLERVPEVQMIPGALSPMLWAPAGKARLLLPVDLVRRLDRGQKVALLAHELAHLRRRDHWVRHLELVVRGLHWWNPLVWWVCRELRRAEEECCDAWVLWALPSASRSYADALVETVDFLCHSHSKSVVPAAASGAGHAQNLKWRLTMIMRGQTRRSLSGAGRAVVCTLAVATLSLAPAFGQSSKEEMREIEAKLEAAQAKVEAIAEQLEELEEARDDLDSAGRTDKAEQIAKKIHKIRLVRDKMRVHEEQMADKLYTIRRYAVAGQSQGHGHGEGHGGAHGERHGGADYFVSRGAGRAQDPEGGHEEEIEAIHAGIKALKKLGDLEAAEELAKVAKKLSDRRKSHGVLARILHDPDVADQLEGHVAQLTRARDLAARASTRSSLGTARADHDDNDDDSLLRVRRTRSAHEAGKAIARVTRDGDDADVAKLHQHLVHATVGHQDRVERLEQKVDQLADLVHQLIKAEKKSDKKERKEGRSQGHGR